MWPGLQLAVPAEEKYTHHDAATKKTVKIMKARGGLWSFLGDPRKESCYLKPPFFNMLDTSGSNVHFLGDSLYSRIQA